MKKFLLICGSLLLVLAYSENSFALLIKMGSDSWIDTSGTNSVLQLQASTNPTIAGKKFNLEDGGSAKFWFAKISSDESWINDDDLNIGTVKDYIDFAVPDMTGIIGGTSIGFSGCWNFVQGWKLIWNDPVELGFVGGTLSIELDDAYYKSGWWSGSDGSDCISAKITLSPANTVSEPANMLLMGTALVGLAGASRKKIFKKK